MDREEEIIRWSRELSIEEFFTRLPGFKNWIENTHVFATLQHTVGSGLIIKIFDLQLKLDKDIKIDRAEDLPIEMIMEFYKHSPWKK